MKNNQDSLKTAVNVNISGSHGGEYEDDYDSVDGCLLGCSTV
jgi:hypothetical protein